MADTEKRISFTGVDNGVGSQIEKLRRQSSDLGADMIRQSREYSKSGKEQISFIEDQIRAIERRNRLDREGQEISAKKAFRNGGDGGVFSSTMSSIASTSREDDMQTKLLRELIDTIKLTAKEEISEDRKGVERQVSLLKRGKFEGTAEEELKVKYQRELLKGGDGGDGSGKGGVMGDVFMGTLLANMLGKIQQTITNLPNAKNEEQVISGIISSFSDVPFIGAAFGAYGQAYGRMTEERLSMQKGRGKVRGLTGNMGYEPASLSQYGLDYGETAALTEQSIRSRGGSNVSVSDVMAMQKAFSLDGGAVQQRVGLQRISSGERTFLDEMLTIFNNLEEGQQVLFSEVAQNQGQLVNDFSRTVESVDQSLATEQIFKFGAVGGGFSIGDPRSMERIRTINQNLSNPASDIMRAENLSILRKSKPNAGMFDLIEMQEQGIQNPELLKGIMSNIKSRYGSDDQYGMMAFQKRTGLNASAARQLYENFDAYSAEGLTGEQMMTRAGVSKRAGAVTPDLEKSQAEIANAFVAGAEDGMMMVAKKVGGTIATYIELALSDVKDEANKYTGTAEQKAQAYEAWLNNQGKKSED